MVKNPRFELVLEMNRVHRYESNVALLDFLRAKFAVKSEKEGFKGL